MSHCSTNPMHCKNCSSFNKSVFSSLSDENLNLLVQQKENFTRNRGETFNVQGESANEIYCLREGSAKVVLTSTPFSQQSIVRLAADGDLLGYRCIFSEETFRATASALAPTSACKINKETVFQLIEKDPQFSRELLKRMGKEISAAENHHHSFCKKNVRERVAEALLILKEKSSIKTEIGWQINIHLTRNEMASWVGTAKETLIRCLSDFKEEQLIEQTDDNLVIINIEKLKQVSGVILQNSIPLISL